MSHDFEEREEDQDDLDLNLSKVKKSAVLELDENESEAVIGAVDEDFESDVAFEDEEEVGAGFAMYESSEEEDMSLQF